MEIVNTKIKDLVIIQPKVFSDSRGYFMESYKENFFSNNFPKINFVQDNESKSEFGVLRGLHFQKPPYDQTKLVRVVQGEVLDVAVDLRIGSETYGKYESFILSDVNKKQLLIPRGFAHGFVVTSKIAIFQYKVDNVYSPDHDSGILYNDPNLKIDWILDSKNLIISEKDLQLDELKDLESPFFYR